MQFLAQRGFPACWEMKLWTASFQHHGCNTGVAGSSVTFSAPGSTKQAEQKDRVISKDPEDRKETDRCFTEAKQERRRKLGVTGPLR